MTQAQAEALQISAWLRKSNEEAMAWRMDAADAIERLHAQVQKLGKDLVDEAARTAAEKLRADQMTLQHDMQSAMHREARRALAEEAEATNNWRRNWRADVP